MKKKLKQESEEENITQIQVGDILVVGKKGLSKTIRNILKDKLIKDYLQVHYTQKIMPNLNYIS